MNKIMIRFNSVDFHYPKQEKLLENLNFKLETGRIHGLLGKNGEGKSTLLKLIAGLLFPKKGEIKVLDYFPQERRPELLQKIYFLPEALPKFTISIEIFQKVYAPFYPKFDGEQFNSYLKEFDIKSKEVKFNQLSQGQAKKVMIAFGLASNTLLLLMDEPTNGLDIPSKAQFRRIVASTLDEERSILLSTHQVRDLDSLIDSILILDNHKIILNESLETIGEKLLFRTSEITDQGNSVIYSEESLRGYLQVLKNVKGEESKPDIELFFNAILSNKTQIENIFNSKS